MAQSIASSVLMETASRNAIAMCPLFEHPTSILIACGNGNNGGDGYAMARMLSERHSVVVAAMPNAQAMSNETHANYLRVIDGNIPIIHPDLIAQADVSIIVDALIGIGGNSDLRTPVDQWTCAINSHKAQVVAVDVPSGLDATTGQAHACAVSATYTMTMEALKPGLLGSNGRRLCGRIIPVSIGAPDGMASAASSTFVLEAKDVRRILPTRVPRSHKYMYGHVMVLAGSQAMRGAAALAAEAALRVGAGLVTLVSDAIHPLLPREVMTASLDMAESVARRASVIVAGPGWGREEERLHLLAKTICAVPETPVVLDADGIRALPLFKGKRSSMIITPHEGEFQWLCNALNITPTDGQIPTAQQAAKALECTIHLKTIPPTSTDGKQTFLCTTGNPGLATAGSGDVLSGIIGGLLAQGVPQLQAAALGAMIHGAAADKIVGHCAHESLIAGDLLCELGTVLAQ